jgi:hypothetical protein
VIALLDHHGRIAAGATPERLLNRLGGTRLGLERSQAVRDALVVNRGNRGGVP